MLKSFQVNKGLIDDFMEEEFLDHISLRKGTDHFPHPFLATKVNIFLFLFRIVIKWSFLRWSFCPAPNFLTAFSGERWAPENGKFSKTSMDQLSQKTNEFWAKWMSAIFKKSTLGCTLKKLLVVHRQGHARGQLP